jgi:hypothetical protein
MAKESNVIQFPSRGKPVQPAPSEQEITTNISFMKYNHINETLNTLVPMIFNNIELCSKCWWFKWNNFIYWINLSNNFLIF